MDIRVLPSLGRLKMWIQIFLLIYTGYLLAVPPPPGHSSMYSRSGYYYSDYSYTQTVSKVPVYLPGPQYCPETGRTICKDVPYYPEERIYMILSNSKAHGFNLSTVFVDEREGDAQPNRAQLPDWPSPIPRDRSYVLYRPTAVHHDYNVPNRRPWNSGWRKQLRSSPPYTKEHNVKRRNQDMETACTSKRLFIPPRAGLNDKSQWKYVINVANLNARYKQIIQVEVCEFPNRPCSSQISLPFGYISRCTQKHIKKKLLSLDADGQSTSEDSFFVPSCCVCEIVRNFGN